MLDKNVKIDKLKIKIFNYLFIILLSLLYNCERKEWKNIYDPNCSTTDIDWAPKEFRIEQISAKKLILNWKQYNLKIEGFKIDRKISNSKWKAEYVVLPTTMRECVDSLAVPDSIHYYRLYAYAGDSKSSFISKSITPGFPAPENLKIKELSESEVQLTWDKHPFNDIIGYKIERQTNFQSFEEINSTTDIYYDDKGLSFNNTYTYRIKAFAEEYISKPSNKIKIAPIPSYLLIWIGYHLNIVFSVEFSPDGSKVASGSADETLRVWTVETGTQIWTGFHDRSITSVNFNSDNSKVVSGGGWAFAGTVKVWNVVTGDLIWKGDHGSIINSVNFSPDNSKVVSGSSDAIFKVWNSETGDLIWKGDHTTSVNSVSFSPDNSKIVSGGGFAVKVWNAETRDLLWTGNHEGSIITSVNFSPDNNKIVSGSGHNAGSIKVWDATTGNLLWSHNLSYEVLSVNFSQDNSKVVSGSGVWNGGTVNVWDALTGNILWTANLSDGVRSVNFSPDNSKVVAGSEDNMITVYDANTGNIIWNGNHGGAVMSVDISSDNSKLVSGGCDYTVKVWRSGYAWRITDGA